MTDPVTVVIVVLALAGIAVIGWLAYQVRNLDRNQGSRADVAAADVDDVRRTLRAATSASDIKLSDLADVARATHALVNSSMATQLYINMVVTRRLADLTGEPADVAAAGAASRLYDEHQGRQAVADAGGPGA